ncbi:RNase P modulator RnpM [Calidifontibacillus oryziterrae]|uniref:RNase P modulator RnpM n=1 Tax=Calidifontibacillus oryziterrae TaxID=1191699 RepID=UPI00031134B9|nr:YlxR family protein [Calidifontibacillus oryziterrae]
MKNRKIPLRKCVASQEMKPKRELIRIVRSKEGDVSIDPTGKMPGRGAYISKDKQCILDAKKKNVLEHHLGVKVDESIYNELLQFIEKEQR